MNAEGAQEKNKWNDVELCGIMRSAPIIEDYPRATGWVGGPGDRFSRPVVLRAVNIGDF